MDLFNSQFVDGGFVYFMNCYGVMGIFVKLYFNVEVYMGMFMYDKVEIVVLYIIDSGQYVFCGEGCFVFNLGKCLWVDLDFVELEGYVVVFVVNNEGNLEYIFFVCYDEVIGVGMNFSQMNLYYFSQFIWNFQEQFWNGYVIFEEFYNFYEDGDVCKENNFIVGFQLDFSGFVLLDYVVDDDDIQLNYMLEINELVLNLLCEVGVCLVKFSYKQFGCLDMDNDFFIVCLGEVYLICVEVVVCQVGNWFVVEVDVNVLCVCVGVVEYNGNLIEEEFFVECGCEMFQEIVCCMDLICFGKYNGEWWEKLIFELFVNIFLILQE